jgi:hypothetical protein
VIDAESRWLSMVRFKFLGRPRNTNSIAERERQSTFPKNFSAVGCRKEEMCHGSNPVGWRGG